VPQKNIRNAIENKLISMGKAYFGGSKSGPDSFNGECVTTESLDVVAATWVVGAGGTPPPIMGGGGERGTKWYSGRLWCHG
jgi:hypothetical protein